MFQDPITLAIQAQIINVEAWIIELLNSSEAVDYELIETLESQLKSWYAAGLNLSLEVTAHV